MSRAGVLKPQEGRAPGGRDAEFWQAPNLPHLLRQRVETVFEVLAHLPLEQPLAVVADVGRTLAVNAPLLRLLGAGEPSIVGQMWSRVMPGWPERSRRFRREGEQVFEEHLVASSGDSVWVRVSLAPIAERGEERAMAYILFINEPDVETIDHEEVRRLRKSLQLLADTQTDYVVEVDRAGTIGFVSPSFCRALGVAEKELTGTSFVASVLAGDRDAVEAALAQAMRPPFEAQTSARLAADPGAPVSWQVDAVIGDGVVGFDVVGRPASAAAATVVASPSPPVARPLAPPADPRLAAIKEKLDALGAGGDAALVALAREVAAAAGAECVSYTVRRGDVVEKAVGWRLPGA